MSTRRSPGLSFVLPFAATSVVASTTVAEAPPLAATSSASEPPQRAPVFEGHRDLTIFTKEASLEASLARLGDGAVTATFGLAVGAFYTPWLSLTGGTQFGLGINGARQIYDMRAALRFGLPTPILGAIFPYAALGPSVFFHAQDNTNNNAFTRSFGLLGAVGAFANLAERIRLRLEVRDEWLLSDAQGLDHNLFVTLAFVTLYR
jgi:hypothetical protein